MKCDPGMDIPFESSHNNVIQPGDITVKLKMMDYPLSPQKYSIVSSFFYALRNVSKVNASFKEIYKGRRKGAWFISWSVKETEVVIANNL
jgi:hypothetical protein